MIIIKTNRKTEVIEMLCACSSKCSSEQYFNSLQNLGQKLKKEQDFIELANFGTALSSIERIIILKALIKKDRCVCELEAVLDKSQSTISHHLRKLETAGVIMGYKKGNFTYYHLERDKLYDYLDRINRTFTIS